MSRSFKKYPVVKDWHQGMKQRTNRSLRAKIKRGELDDLLAVKVIAIGEFMNRGTFQIMPPDMIYTRLPSR